MGASTRLEHAKTHAVRGGSENQSRANKEITSVAHKNIVNAPRQRHVLSDVTNCSPLKTPSRDQIEQQGVKKESNKTRDKMEQELEQAVLTEAQKDLPTSSLAPTKRSLRPRKNKETEAVEAPKSPASEPQEIPKSPVATKTPVAKRPARQSKLKVQNRKLSLDATDNSSVSQSERTGDEPVRRTSKRISIRK